MSQPSWGALGLCVYPGSVASTRLRLESLGPAIRARGGSLDVRSFLGEEQYREWSRGGRGRLTSVGRGLVRSLSPQPRAGVVVVQREAVPANAAWFERRLVGNRPLVWDVDDAVWRTWSGPSSHVRGTRAKYRWLASRATVVWAGNDELADWCRENGARDVRVVPPTVTMPDNIVAPTEPRRLAWVGTPSTAPFLSSLLEREAAHLQDWIVEVVGGQVEAPPGVRVEQHPWTAANEDRALRRAWAGLYPIDHGHPLAEGKAGLKAVLFGAYGVPTLATRTRATAEIVRDGTTGIVLAPGEGWGPALQVVADPARRAAMSTAARARVAHCYNADTWLPRLADDLHALATGSPRA